MKRSKNKVDDSQCRGGGVSLVKTNTPKWINGLEDVKKQQWPAWVWLVDGRKYSVTLWGKTWQAAEKRERVAHASRMRAHVETSPIRWIGPRDVSRGLSTSDCIPPARYNCKSTRGKASVGCRDGGLFDREHEPRSIGPDLAPDCWGTSRRVLPPRDQLVAKRLAAGIPRHEAEITEQQYKEWNDWLVNAKRVSSTEPIDSDTLGSRMFRGVSVRSVRPCKYPPTLTASDSPSQSDAARTITVG